MPPNGRVRVCEYSNALMTHLFLMIYASDVGSRPIWLQICRTPFPMFDALKTLLPRQAPMCQWLPRERLLFPSDH
jgi:hypothetical protein